VREFALNVSAISRYQQPEREKVLRLLTLTTESLWPSATVSVYGSAAKKLALPDSDLDVLVHGKWGMRGDEEVLPCMRILCEKLELCEGWVLQATVRETRVPVIRLSVKTEATPSRFCSPPPPDPDPLTLQRPHDGRRVIGSRWCERRGIKMSVATRSVERGGIGEAARRLVKCNSTSLSIARKNPRHGLARGSPA